MMMFWNRIEIYCGYCLEEFCELRDILAVNHLKYDYRLVNRSHYTRARFGTLGQDLKTETQYYLYVHKKDYENAMFHLHSSRIR